MSVRGKATLVIPAGACVRSISFTFRKASVNISTRTSDSFRVKVILIVTGPGPLTGFGYTTTPFFPTGVAVPVEAAIRVFVEVAVGVEAGMTVKVAVGEDVLV